MTYNAPIRLEAKTSNRSYPHGETQFVSFVTWDLQILFPLQAKLPTTQVYSNSNPASMPPPLHIQLRMIWDGEKEFERWSLDFLGGWWTLSSSHLITELKKFTTIHLWGCLGITKQKDGNLCHCRLKNLVEKLHRFPHKTWGSLVAHSTTYSNN